MHVTSRKLPEIKINNTFFLFFYRTLSLKCSLPKNCLTRRCVVTITEHIWRLEIELNADSGSVRGQNKETFVTERKGGGEVDKAWPRREGSLSLFCMHGGFCGRRSWQGAAVLPPALRQQMLRSKRRPEGTATRRAPSPSLSSPACHTLSPPLHTHPTPPPHTPHTPHCNIQLSTSNGLPINPSNLVIFGSFLASFHLSPQTT